MPHISTGAINLYYQLSGPDGAPVVCLSHCFAADHRYWDPHLSALDGFRLLRYDTRGHGNSDQPPGPYTLSMLAGDVAGLCQVLGIERVHFCGVSLGGQIGQHFALDYPEKVMSLTLVNSTCEFSEKQITLWRQRTALASREGMGAVRGPLMQRWFTQQAADVNIAGYQYMDTAIQTFTSASFDAVTAAMCQLDTGAKLDQIKVPAMVVASADDPGVPKAVSERMASLIPDCQLHWLEPARHLSSLEHPERFNALLRTFLLRPRAQKGMDSGGISG